MKTVGKQLEEGRLGKKWTPEMASRETKIRVDRLLDLESDNFSNFTSPTYARGFVRTYARALSLDEYRLLRQLDQKLPEWDGTLVSDSGVVYMPQPANLPQITPRGNRWGGAVLYGLCVIAFAFITFILYENYKLAGENTKEDKAPLPDLVATPPPAPNTPVAALPVNPADLPPAVVPAKPLEAAVTPDPAPPSTTPTDPNSAPLVATTTPVPLDPAPLDLSKIPVAPAVTADPNPTPAPVTTDGSTPVVAKAVAVDPEELARVMQSQSTPPVTPSAPPKSLSLRAKGDCRVTIYQVEKNGKSQIIYSKTLHAGDSSIDFDGDRFTIKLSDPAMMDINVLDVPYPHSQDHSPETLSVKVTHDHPYN
jgi:cytoskeleton protein RodZ